MSKYPIILEARYGPLIPFTIGMAISIWLGENKKRPPAYPKIVFWNEINVHWFHTITLNKKYYRCSIMKNDYMIYVLWSARPYSYKLRMKK